MRYRTPLGALAILVIALLGLPGSAQAQLGRRLRDTAKRAAESELQRKVDHLVRDAVRCAIDDPTCFSGASEGGKEVIFTDKDGEIIVDDDGVPVTDRQQAAKRAGVDAAAPGVESEAATPRPGEGAWANYDFVPGEKVLFFEDYSADRVGDFPRRLEFLEGNWEIVEWEGRRLLRNTGPRSSAFKIMLPKTLPERFTIELEAYFPSTNHQMMMGTVAPGANRHWDALTGNIVRIGVAHGTGVDRRGEGVRAVNPTPQVSESLQTIRVMVDRRYAKVYVGEQRVANVPNAEFARSNELYLENIYSASVETPLYLGSIRIAEGGLDLYDKLAADGRVSTQGILFAVGSAVIQPESTPTLEEIGTILKEHSDLRLRIEGHTDATGNDASNQTLSEDRARAVRQFLIDTYGIDAVRLESEGYGESQPVDSNDTAEGRQNNRRVELVRLDGSS